MDIGEETEQSSDVQKLIRKIEKAEKYFKPWWERVDKIVKRYRDEQESKARKVGYNILWSNKRTLKPMLYSATPKVAVTGRLKNGDPMANLGAIITERCMEYACDIYDVDYPIGRAVDDFILAARGQLWVQYSAEQEAQEVAGEEVEVKTDESVRLEYVYYKDFLHDPARGWEEVSWVARIAHMTKDEVEDRFGEEIASALEYQNKDPDSSGDKDKCVANKARVYEVWDKHHKRVYWVSKEYGQGFLDESDDILGLQNFFPCPRPAFDSMANDSLIPIPEYSQYQDLAAELDETTQRIKLLIRQIAVRGVYDKGQTSLSDLLSSDCENKLIPVDNWAALVGAGGLKGVVDFMPIDATIMVLKGLYENRQRLLTEIYEITGHSDLMRGVSDPRETASAQNQKAGFLNTRLGERQREIQRFIRDAFEIKAEVIFQQYDPERLAMIAGFEAMQPMEQQMFMPVLEMLKSDLARNYRVDLETDSTIAPDEAAEKQRRLELLQAVGDFFINALPMIQQAPMLAPVVGEMLMFGVRAFRTGKELEGSLKQAMQAIAQQAAQPQQPQPDPKMIEMQGKQQMEQAKLQMQAQKQQGDLQVASARIEGERALKEMQIAGDLQLKRERAQAELELKAQAALDAQALARAQAMRQQFSQNS